MSYHPEERPLHPEPLPLHPTRDNEEQQTEDINADSQEKERENPNSPERRIDPQQ